MALTRDISSWPFTSTLSSAVTFTTLPMTPQLREPEVITASKEFCDCEFSWYSAKGNALEKDSRLSQYKWKSSVRVIGDDRTCDYYPNMGEPV